MTEDKYNGRQANVPEVVDTIPTPPSGPRAPSSDSDAALGRVLRDEFRIDRPLGSGGMSRVYLGHQLSVDRPVVIKLMTPPPEKTEQWRARFLQEARAASRVRHTGIVTIYSFGDDEELGAYIAMEYVDGRTLREILQEQGRLEPGRACRLVAQVCRALNVAHDAGIVHRDLKPDNVMVDVEDGRERARVLDFGVAKASNPLVTTLDGLVVGTPAYMPPEQARNQPIDARADVYSMGIILYELLFGRRPFLAPTATALMLKHVQEPLPLEDFDSEWPASLREILETACAKSPDARFESAGAMAAALEDVDQVDDAQEVGNSESSDLIISPRTGEQLPVDSDAERLLPEELGSRPTERLDSHDLLDNLQEMASEPPRTRSLTSLVWMSLALLVTAGLGLAALQWNDSSPASPPQTAPVVAKPHAATPPVVAEPVAQRPVAEDDRVQWEAATAVRVARATARGVANGSGASAEEPATRRDRAPERGEKSAAPGTSSEEGEIHLLEPRRPGLLDFE